MSLFGMELNDLAKELLLYGKIGASCQKFVRLRKALYSTFTNNKNELGKLLVKFNLQLRITKQFVLVHYFLI